MSTESNKAVVERFRKALNAGNLDRPGGRWANHRIVALV